MRRVTVLVVVLGLCIAGAVATLAGPPGDLSKEDLAAIQEETDRFAEGMRSGDRAAVAATYTKDAVLCPPNQPMVKSREAIKTWMDAFPPVTEFVVTNDEVDGRGDVAYVRGSYTMTIQPAEGPAIKDSGKYVEIRRKQPDGRWLLAVDIFNSDLPTPAAPE